MRRNMYYSFDGVKDTNTHDYSVVYATVMQPKKICMQQSNLESKQLTKADYTNHDMNMVIKWKVSHKIISIVCYVKRANGFVKG